MDSRRGAAGKDHAPAAAGPRDPAAGLSARQHRLGFLFSGFLAFSVDTLVLLTSIHILGANPLLAKIGAISVAMVAGWLAHRRWTFALATRPTFREFRRYATAGWLVVLVNYGMFSLLLFMNPQLPPLIASTVASVGSMIFSYLAMRYSVFRRQ